VEAWRQAKREWVSGRLHEGLQLPYAASELDPSTSRSILCSIKSAAHAFVSHAGTEKDEEKRREEDAEADAAQRQAEAEAYARWEAEEAAKKGAGEE